MKYFKFISDGYILLISTGYGQTEISEEEYNTILQTIKSKPHGAETTDYRLKEDLTWEEFEIEVVEETDEEEEA